MTRSSAPNKPRRLRLFEPLSKFQARLDVPLLKSIQALEPQENIESFEEILNLCLEQDYREEPLFEFLFQVLRLPLQQRILRRLAGKYRSELPDLLSATMESIHRLILKAQTPLGYGLFLSIADHRAIDHLRRRRPEYWANLEHLQLEQSNPERELLQHQRSALATELRDAVLEAVNDLPQRERQALIMVELKELSYSEVARSLRLRDNEIGNLLRRARLKRDRLLLPRLRRIQGLENNLGYSGLRGNAKLRRNLLRWSSQVGEGVCPHCAHLHARGRCPHQKRFVA